MLIKVAPIQQNFPRKKKKKLKMCYHDTTLIFYFIEI